MSVCLFMDVIEILFLGSVRKIVCSQGAVMRLQTWRMRGDISILYLIASF